MEICVQCKKIKKNEDLWKTFVARYHDVEIKHHVCPQCSTSSFPETYKVYEDANYDKGGIDKNFMDRNYPIAMLHKLKTKYFPG